jgi:CRP-like cAMP-binding protein
VRNRSPGHRPAQQPGLRPFIRSVPFGGHAGSADVRLSARDREILGSISSVLRVPGRTILCNQGTPSAFVFNIVEGSACVWRPLPDGDSRTMAFLLPGDIFGLARRGVYVNSVTSMTPATVFRFPLDALTALLLRNPELQFQFLCKVTHALRESQRQLLMVTRRDPLERVAMFLAMLDEVHEADETGSVWLPLRAQHIADYLDLQTDAVVKALLALKDRGAVEQQDRGKLHVTDRRRLDGIIRGSGSHARRAEARKRSPRLEPQES